MPTTRPSVERTAEKAFLLSDRVSLSSAHITHAVASPAPLTPHPLQQTQHPRLLGASPTSPETETETKTEGHREGERERETDRRRERERERARTSDSAIASPAPLTPHPLHQTQHPRILRTPSPLPGPLSSSGRPGRSEPPGVQTTPRRTTPRPPRGAPSPAARARLQRRPKMQRRPARMQRRPSLAGLTPAGLPGVQTTPWRAPSRDGRRRAAAAPMQTTGRVRAGPWPAPRSGPWTAPRSRRGRRGATPAPCWRSATGPAPCWCGTGTARSRRWRRRCRRRRSALRWTQGARLCLFFFCLF
ncbi:hypothetical protein T484DRAFT_3078275 [Baffinella frigidus]|nr:hypothetical protein T484DRAFT_3078275 [Cryptophyta sp. CCMP2293]